VIPGNTDLKLSVNINSGDILKCRVRGSLVYTLTLRSLRRTLLLNTRYPEKSWKRIEFALHGSGSGRAYIHYYIAASISFILIFSGIVGIYRNPQAAEEIQATLMNQIGSFGRDDDLNQSRRFISKSPAAISEFSQLNYLAISRVSDRTRPLPSRLNRKKISDLRRHIIIQPQVIVAAKAEIPKLILSMQVGGGVVGGKLAPSATFKTALLIPKSGNTYHTLGVSVSGYGYIEKSESGHSAMNPAVFLNAELGRLKGPLHKWVNRSWGIPGV